MIRVAVAAFTVLLGASTVQGIARADDARPAGAAPATQAAGAAPSLEAACNGPQDAVFAPLAQMARAITARTVDILAVGSATMLGPHGGTEGSFPYLVMAELQKAHPQVAFRLTVRGGRGLTAAEMRASLKTELAQHAYSLVIWQTGTVEAVRGLPADDLLRTLTEGAASIHDAHADLLLIDPQYSRFLRANVDLDPYLQAMVLAAAQPGVALFHRYDLMKSLVDSGQIDLERTAKQERHAVAEALNACMARALAQTIEKGVVASGP